MSLAKIEVEKNISLQELKEAAVVDDQAFGWEAKLIFLDLPRFNSLKKKIKKVNNKFPVNFIHLQIEEGEKKGNYLIVRKDNQNFTI